MNRMMIKKAMNPPASGQNMPAGYRGLRVKRDLLSWSGERPRHLERALLTKDEPQLARWAQPFGMVGTEARARGATSNRTEVVLMKEAVLAACLHPPGRHV